MWEGGGVSYFEEIPIQLLLLSLSIGMIFAEVLCFQVTLRGLGTTNFEVLTEESMTVEVPNNPSHLHPFTSSLPPISHKILQLRLLILH